MYRDTESDNLNVAMSRYTQIVFFGCIVTQLKRLLSDDVLHNLLDQVFPDLILSFTFAGRATYVITLQDHSLLISFLQMVAPEKAVLVEDFHLLHHVLVQFMNLERVGFMFVEMKNDQVFLDFPLTESSVRIIVDKHKGVVSVQMQIQDIFRNLISVGPGHVTLVVNPFASLCG